MKAIDELNHPERSTRLAAAAAVGACIQGGDLRVSQSPEVNNHVHTTYSFSPYCPAMAAYRAYQAGLKAVGIMDHDSVSGAEEMLDAARSIGIASTVGFELRVSFAGTAVAGRKFNNPDSSDIVYVAVHGIPRQRLAEARRFLAPLNAARNARTRRMVDALNRLVPRHGLAPLDFERDVVAISQARDGGSITERHLMCALANAIIVKIGKGEPLVRWVREELGIALPAKIATVLADPSNEHYVFDLLGVLKSSFLERVFIQPGGDECPPVRALVELGERLDAIPVYAYLGDVGESPTGDKKAEHFEDAFLDELMSELKQLGFRGVTYMPPRNTREQLLRVQALCRAHGFMEISGVDINSSRQSFSCPILLEKEFRHLVDATWALIAHEKLATVEERYGLFHPRNPYAGLALGERIARYARVGQALDPRAPERALDVLRKIEREE
jgi:predicted metal-dependent phosphoesterase TrpH